MNRAAAVRRTSLLDLAANVVLAAAKGWVWLATGSLAVGSEAANSLVDAVVSPEHLCVQRENIHPARLSTQAIGTHPQARELGVHDSDRDSFFDQPT
jgi:hypothetical protein